MSVMVGNTTLTSGSPVTVDSTEAVLFEFTVNGNYTLNMTVGGDCTPGGWETIYINQFYSTGPITADCTVTFTAM
jgi:hypothetical protein